MRKLILRFFRVLVSIFCGDAAMGFVLAMALFFGDNFSDVVELVIVAMLFLAAVGAEFGFKLKKFCILKLDICLGHSFLAMTLENDAIEV